MVAFYTQTDKGNGWSADFYISSPINSNENMLIMIIVVLMIVAARVFVSFITVVLLKRKDEHKNKMHSDEGIMLTSLEINAEDNRIGEGPSAIVYRAVCTAGRLVAIKCLRDTASRKQLEEEILHKLSSHPNIISLLGRSEERRVGKECW